MSAEELKAKARQVFDEAWNHGNVGALAGVYTDNFIHHSSPNPDIVGREAYKKFITNVRTSYPDVKVTIVEIFGEGNTTAIRWNLEGTQTGTSPTTGAPPTGKHVGITGCEVAHWADGKIIEQWEYEDWLGLLQQLGVIPAKK